MIYVIYVNLFVTVLVKSKKFIRLFHMRLPVIYESVLTYWLFENKLKQNKLKIQQLCDCKFLCANTLYTC